MSSHPGQYTHKSRPQSTPEATITVRLHESGFNLADSNFYSLSSASDGNIYYTLCSHNIDTSGRLYRYDPRTNKVNLISTLGKALGEEGTKCIQQGKSHSLYFERDGKLFGATHYGFMKPNTDKEEPGTLPEGYLPYPGGH